MEKTLSVSEYLDLVNVALATDEPEIVGEIQGFKVAGQWVMFSLKDEEDQAVLGCWLGIWDFKRIGVSVEDGMKVKVRGKAGINKKRGSFGFKVISLEPVGQGSLKKGYELLLKQLTAEGLFARKRPIPEFIQRIAVVSSRDGVVIHDLRKNLKKLGIKIDFYHSQVEGASAAEDLVRVFAQISKKNEYDVLVVIRGGGSLESLQAFNNEAVCRALYASSIPVVVGIGHDVDVPIACLVADASGSTPTQVAHILNDTWRSLLEDLPRLERELLVNFDRSLERLSGEINLRTHTMANYFERIFSRFSRLEQIVQNSLSTIYRTITYANERVQGIERLLAAANPERNLKLGYSIVSNSRGKVIKNVRDVKIGERITTRLTDGSFDSEVKN